MPIESYLYKDPSETLDRKREQDKFEKVCKENRRRKKRKRITMLVAKARMK